MTGSRKEVVSRALFHCLWESGHRIAALLEADRFLMSGGRMQNYPAILKELWEQMPGLREFIPRMA